MKNWAITTNIQFLFFVLFIGIGLSSQENDTLNNQLLVDLEFRPRIEYRYNHKHLPNDTISPYLFATQRNRVSVSYTYKYNWLINSELQAIHEWDKNNIASKISSINFYQLYIEYTSRRLKFKIGRQGVLLDNGRIFSDAPWAQQSRAHEGIRITEYSSKHSQDLFFLFTRNYGELFEPTYSPVSSHRYKYLVVHHLKMDLENGLSFNTINYLEFFENNTFSHPNTTIRATSGGRLEYQNKLLYATLNGFFQYGQNAQGKHINSYYIQPEIKFSIFKSKVRLGAEIISGSRFQQPSNQSGSFDIRYGVAWKFMGNMNLFTRFPDDVNDRGLINPYCFILVPVTKKISFRSDFHLFYLQNSLQNSSGSVSDNYLGFENDISFRYNLTKRIELNYGFSYLLSESQMSDLPKIIDSNKIAIWNYLMVSYLINVVNSKT
jgi:hypothetical protein